MRRSKPTIYNNVDMKVTLMFENGIFGVWFIGIRVMIIIMHIRIKADQIYVAQRAWCIGKMLAMMGVDM